MSLITLKHFSGESIYLGPWISDGHWAIRRDRVANAASFTSLETFQAAFPRLASLVQTRFLFTEPDVLYAVGPGDTLTDAIDPADRTFYVAPFPTTDQLDPLIGLINAINIARAHDRLAGVA